MCLALSMLEDGAKKESQSEIESRTLLAKEDVGN
jgi:hypothetical protein